LVFCIEKEAKMTKKLLILVVLLLVNIPVFGQSVDIAWVRRYNGPANSYDQANAIALDRSGNVYVTGFSFGVDTGQDYATIKYSPVGSVLWVRRYNGPGNGDDVATNIAVDELGNVYVTGFCSSSETSTDYATIKYSPTGQLLWVRRYNGPGSYRDEGNALVLDHSGNIFVTGQSGNSDGKYDSATIKYRPNGDTAWVRRNKLTETLDASRCAIALDTLGNVYVTREGGTIKYDSDGNELWVSGFGGSKLAVDRSGNVYVTVEVTDSPIEQKHATVKIDPEGNRVWSETYEVEGFLEEPNDIAVDDSGNFYVTGSKKQSGSYDLYEDFETVKYSPSGEVLWHIGYDGPGNEADRATSIAVDRFGNVYVAEKVMGVGLRVTML
jgi:hypothetical protein